MRDKSGAEMIGVQLQVMLAQAKAEFDLMYNIRGITGEAGTYYTKEKEVAPSKNGNLKDLANNWIYTKNNNPGEGTSMHDEGLLRVRAPDGNGENVFDKCLVCPMGNGGRVPFVWVPS